MKKINKFYHRNVNTIIEVPVIMNKEQNENIECIVNGIKGNIPIRYFTKKYDYVKYPFWNTTNLNYRLNNANSNLEVCNLLSGKKLRIVEKITVYIYLNQEHEVGYTKISIFEEIS